MVPTQSEQAAHFDHLHFVSQVFALFAHQALHSVSITDIVATEVVVVVVVPATKFEGHSHRVPVGQGQEATEHVHTMLDTSPEGLCCVSVNVMLVPVPVGHPVQV